MVSTYVRRGPYQKTAPFPGFSLAQWDGHVTILSSHAVVGRPLAPTPEISAAAVAFEPAIVFFPRLLSFSFLMAACCHLK